jgi:outer membrane receptor protein involved in Fe transport
VVSSNLAYTDKYPITTDTNFVINRIVMVNAQLQWDSAAVKGLSVQLWGKNLANEYYYTSPTESSGGWYATPGTPRTYGVNVLERF